MGQKAATAAAGAAATTAAADRCCERPERLVGHCGDGARVVGHSRQQQQQPLVGWQSNENRQRPLPHLVVSSSQSTALPDQPQIDEHSTGVSVSSVFSSSALTVIAALAEVVCFVDSSLHTE